MGDLLIRNIPDDLRSALKARASAVGRSQSEEAKAMIESVIKAEVQAKEKAFVSAWDAFAEFRKEYGMNDDEHAEFMKIIEEGRKVPDRPPPFQE